MKTGNIFRTVLAVAAALALVSCSNDVNVPETVRVIPYTVTVGEVGTETRATVDADNKTLRFAAGDQLRVQGEGVIGMLSIVSGVGSTDNATFSGELTLTGGSEPTSDLPLSAIIQSAEQRDSYNYIHIRPDDTVAYPTDEYCYSVSEAVKLYSCLKGTSTFGKKSFTLTQHTAFLNFVITFEDGTVADNGFTATVRNNSAVLCAERIYTTNEDDKIVAKFVLPVAAGTVLNGATVQIGTKDPISFGAGQELTGKVYNVFKTQGPPAPTVFSLAESAPGMIVGTDGNAYALSRKGNLPEGVTAAGMVASKNSFGGGGIVLALADDGKYSWDDSWDRAANHSPEVNGQSWALPSVVFWQDCLDAFGGLSGLNAALVAAGGDALKSEEWYWTSDSSAEGAYALCGGSFVDSLTSEDFYVRACFGF